MKKPIILFGTLLCSVAIFWFTLKSFHFSNENIAKELEEENREEEEKESGVAGQMMSWFTARAYPDPYYLNDKFLRGWQQAQAIRNQQLSTRNARLLNGTWNSIGPNSVIGGRILTIAIDPANSNNLFAGSASGGIWKSTNGGTLWSSVTTGFPVLGVSSIIIDPLNSNILYAGTGEVYRADSTTGTPNPGNIGFNVWKTRGTYGIGILKSTNGGSTWTRIMNKATSQLFAIQTLKFDPSSSSIVYACATDGLYRSTNSGSSWTKILDLTYVSDVVINGTNIVASVGNLGNTKKGIYKSTDNGITWAKITTGFPASFQGFIKLDCVSAAPNTIVASIGVSSAAGVNELYQSTNFGTSWVALNNSTHTQWQYWSAHDVAINPFAIDSLIFGGVKSYRYKISTAGISSTLAMHDDIHDVQFDVAKRGTAYICGDGGIYRTTNGGTSWSAVNNGLAATQFYASLGVSTTNPNFFVGGLQDNGQVYYNGTTWTTVSGVGGDGTTCAIDPSNNNNVLVSRDARGVYKSTNGAVSGSNTATYWGSVADSRTAFAAPLAYSKSNTAIVYLGSDNLHKSTDGGTSWSNNAYSSAANYIDAQRKTAIALAVSPTNANKVYVSVSNFAQYDNDVDNLYITGNPNVLKTITGNTPFTSIMGSGGTALPNRFIMDFAISKTNDDSVFVAVGGFGTSHVYVTGDGGANWVSKGTGLPDVPFNAVLFDPVDPKVIYAGGDLGIYVSPDRGNTWYDYNSGFWDAVQVVDIQATSDNQLVAATHGKGVFQAARYSGILPVTLISFTGSVLNNSNKLQWKVGQEINVSRYEIEKSVDATTFKKFAIIKASNRSDYQFEDALPDNNSYYYRLKTVDNDATYKYSDVIYLKRTSKTEFLVINNPFQNDIRIQFSIAQNTRGQISLYDAGGKLIRSESLKITSGQFTYSMNNLGALPSGIYFVEAIVNNQRWKQQLFKK